MRAARVGRTLAAVLMGVLVAFASPSQGQSSFLFQEGFEDSNFAGRGWYDSTGGTLSSTQQYSGARSYECRFPVGATVCTGGTPARHLFAATDQVYVSFYIKHSANWTGSNRGYHPHEFLLMTDVDPAYIGPAYTHLTGYIEENEGVPRLLIQDGRNIDETRIGQDLTNITEQRSVAGCNGDSDGYRGDCYPMGSVHWNAKKWDANGVYFDSNSGSSRYKGNWHLVEAYFRLNTIANGKGMKDGIVRYWYDGALLIDHTNVLMRTGAHPTMKFNQFQMAPWIGDGSPVDQSFWIDDLLVATARPAAPPLPPGSTSNVPAAPLNVRIVP